MSPCSIMRTTVTLSAALLASGLLLLLAGESTDLILPMALAALVMVLAGAALLGVAFLLAVLPGGGQRLSNCQH